MLWSCHELVLLNEAGLGRLGWSEGSAGWWTMVNPQPQQPSYNGRLGKSIVDVIGILVRGNMGSKNWSAAMACHGTPKLTCHFIGSPLRFLWLEPIIACSSPHPRPRWVCSWFLSGCADPPHRTPAPHRHRGPNTVAHKTPDPPHSISPGR